jgi:CheY-like chemotaxis protein
VPLRRAQGLISDQPPESKPPIELNSGRLRILLAEDHVVNRLTVELILEHLPVDITAVENGAEAVEAYKAHAYDLVLMDMQMPVMDGLAAIRNIRAWEAQTHRPRTPVCVLSANALSEHREAAAQAGTDDFLTKPIKAQDLIRHVMQLAASGADGLGGPC